MIFSLHNIVLDHLTLLDNARSDMTFSLYIARSNQSCFSGPKGHIQSIFQANKLLVLSVILIEEQDYKLG